MKQRSPIAVFLLPFVTFGIYSLVWQVKTKNEMNQQGAIIPTAWLLIVPFVNLYWLWKYSEGVEKVTNGAISGVLAFVLQALLGTIGEAIIQNEFNKPVTALTTGMSVPSPSSADGAAPIAPVATPELGPLPDASFGGPVGPVVPADTPAIAEPVIATPTFAPTTPVLGATAPVTQTDPTVNPAPSEPFNAQPPQQS